jgi:hypothetical protein
MGGTLHVWHIPFDKVCRIVKPEARVVVFHVVLSEKVIDLADLESDAFTRCFRLFIQAYNRTSSGRSRSIVTHSKSLGRGMEL